MIGNAIQHGDWKSEKHVPIIQCPDSVKADEFFDVTVTLGQEIAHPNTTEHHIRWMAIYFQPEGGKFIYDVARFQFNAHGEAASGPNEGPVYANHSGNASLKIDKPGTISVVAYCNIHGLWENTKEIALA